MLNCQSKLKCFYWSESNPHILNVKLNISAFSLYGAIFIALALFITSLSSPSFPDLVSTHYSRVIFALLASKFEFLLIGYQLNI